MKRRVYLVCGARGRQELGTPVLAQITDADARGVLAPTHHRLPSRTPGFRPSVNSKPAASSTWRRLSMVRLRSFSPRSKRRTVSGDTFAAAANFPTLKPMAALAIRHCTGSTFQNLSMFRCRMRCHNVIAAAARAPAPIMSRINNAQGSPSINPE